VLDLRRVLNPKGTYVMVGGPPGKWIDPLPRAAGALVLSRFVSQDMGMFLAELNRKDLTVLRDLLQAGKLTPVIDRSYGLSEVPAAIRYLEQGHARGKVVVTLE
jgi:NADPH:quinone reductase-like Zn-dependent oxidoreductase